MASLEKNQTSMNPGGEHDDKATDGPSDGQQDQPTQRRWKQHSRDTCLKRFRKISTLRAHQRTHAGKKSYRCYQYLKRFRTSAGMNVHWDKCTREKLALSINKLKELQLEDNTVVGNATTSLKENQTSMNPGGEHDDKATDGPSDGQQDQPTQRRWKQHSRDTCLKRFRKISTLRAHQRTHAGKKSYRCYQYLKRFRTSAGMNVHWDKCTREKLALSITELKELQLEENTVVGNATMSLKEV
ncbi:zinc finger protein 700-like [Poecilia reticulata]|uniref:zinc finger protein 700-like n=1 Tax=Poecilia reticulata TaxID=8081 RepID=UPI0004A47FEA|nr:PREDICTED: zinc finger protein 700-like [Poecilia reticulata]